MTADTTKGAVQAGVWTVAGKLIARILDFVTLLVLARILSPSDFGLVAMAMTAVLIAEAVLQLPLTQALIRIKNPTPSMYNTAFTLSLVRGVVLALLLGGGSFFLASFYSEPRLVSLIWVLAFAPILRGMLSPKMVVFMQRLDFRREFLLDLCGKLMASIAAISFAAVTKSYWAIVIGTVMTPLVMNIMTYIFAPYMPRLELTNWKQFRGMIGWSSVSQFFAAFNWQIDRFVLGRFVDASSLGRYSLSSDLSGVPIQALVAPIINPLMASFSLTSDLAEKKLAYLKASNALLVLAGPILIGLGLLSEEFVLLALGEEWLPAAPILQVMCIVMVFVVPVAPMPPMAMAQDKTQAMAMVTFLEFLVKLPLTIWGVYYFSIEGALGARAIAALVVLLCGALMVKWLVKVSVWSQFLNLSRSALALLAMAGSMIWAHQFFPSQGLEVLYLLFKIACLGLIGVVVFIISLFLIWKIVGSPEGVEKDVCERMVR